MNQKESSEDRAATLFEIIEAHRIVTADQAASREEVEWANEREQWWLEFMQSPEFRNLVDENRLRVKALKGAKGEFAQIEIRDFNGALLFFSAKKEFDEASRRFETGMEQGAN